MSLSSNNFLFNQALYWIQIPLAVLLSNGICPTISAYSAKVFDALIQDKDSQINLIPLMIVKKKKQRLCACVLLLNLINSLFHNGFVNI